MLPLEHSTLFLCSLSLPHGALGLSVIVAYPGHTHLISEYVSYFSTETNVSCELKFEPAIKVTYFRIQASASLQFGQSLCCSHNEWI